MTNLRKRLQDFLRHHTTMSLATVSPEGLPQSAAVFYAADERLNLYFLSSPNSRHCCNLKKNPHAAITVHADGQAWQEIRGLQIEGTVDWVAGLGQTALAAKVYAARFDFLKGLLDAVGGGSRGGATGEAVTLRGALAGSRFLVLRPTWIRLIDNRQGFGHTEEISVEELRWP